MLKREDFSFIVNIIHRTSAHTLALELIDKYGFTHIAPEKIEFMRDVFYYNNTLQRVLSEIFTVNKLSEKTDRAAENNIVVRRGRNRCAAASKAVRNVVA